MPFEHGLYFRRAVESDQSRLLEWANEAETRRQSFQGHIITREEHARWFQNALRDENTQILILCLQQRPMGNVRFSIEGASAVLSYSIDCGYRGCGFGQELIKMAVDYARESLGLSSLRAMTKLDNPASQKVLLKNGFLRIEELPDRKGVVFFKDLTASAFYVAKGYL